MDTCEALFVVEGATVLPLFRSFLSRLYKAEEDEPLRILSFRQNPERLQSEARRAKFRVGERIIGLFNAGGKDEASDTIRILATLYRRGLFQNLSILTLVRDQDDRSPDSLRTSLAQSVNAAAGASGSPFIPTPSGPVLGEVNGLKIALVLLGDPSFEGSGSNTLEDHIVQFLDKQPKRDPRQLVKVVEAQLGAPLSLKQQVQLAMVVDRYWSAPGGFYERVVEDVPVPALRSVARKMGLPRIMKELSP